MDTSLFQFPVRRRRDVILARQQARRVARLLGYDLREQAGIAAAVFEVACTVLERHGRGVLEFHLHDDRFAVYPLARASGDWARSIPGPGLRLEKRLPERARDVDPSDLAWIVREVGRLAPPSLFKEIRQQNRELLQSLHAVPEAATPEARPARRHKPAA